MKGVRWWSWSMRAKRLREGLDSSDCPLDRLEFDSMSIKLSETSELTNNYYHHETTRCPQHHNSAK